MLPYLFCFVTVMLEIVISETLFRKGNKKGGIVFCVLAAVTMAFFAGLRDLTVGTDVLGYVAENYDRASEQGLMSMISTSNEEPGFVALCFLCNKLFGNIHILLFIIELIIAGFVIAFMKDNRKKQPMYFMMAVYLLLCYVESFCIIRQHMALAICLYATKFVNKEAMERGDVIKIAASLLLAMSFHASAAVFLIIYLIIYLHRMKSIERRNRIISRIVAMSLLLFVTLFAIILFADINSLSGRYFEYFYKGSDFVGRYGINNIGRIIYKLIWLLLFILVANKRNGGRDKNIPVLLLTIDLALYIISIKYTILARFGILLFDSALLIYGGNLLSLTEKKTRYLIVVMVMILLSVNFKQVVMRKTGTEGSYNVYPYVLEDDIKDIRHDRADE